MTEPVPYAQIVNVVAELSSLLLSVVQKNASIPENYQVLANYVCWVIAFEVPYHLLSIQLSRENYIEHMGDIYTTQDTIAYAEEVIGKMNVKVSRFRHYENEVVDLTLKMTA